MSSGHFHLTVRGHSSFGIISAAAERSGGKLRTVVSRAAYNAGERLEDTERAQLHDFTGRAHSVIETMILAPPDAPSWATNRQSLWNHVRLADAGRVNARGADELEIALPHQLNQAQRRELLVNFVQQEIVDKYRVVADVALHTAHDDRNFHSHVMLTHKTIGADGFGAVANQRVQSRWRHGLQVHETISGIAATPADVTAWRERWAEHANRALAAAGLDVRIDHRSYQDQGLDIAPTVHLGKAATALERKGEETKLGAVNRAIAARNAARQQHPQKDANLHLKDKQWLDHVPSGLRKLTPQDIARELSPSYATAAAAADKAASKVEHAKRSFEHWDQQVAVAAYRIAERRAAMGLGAKLLNVVRPDPEVANWQREQRKAEIMRDRAGVHFGAARDAGAAHQRRAAAALEAIRPEAEAELAKRQQTADQARAVLHRLDHQQRQAQTRRLKYDQRLKP